MWSPNGNEGLAQTNRTEEELILANSPRSHPLVSRRVRNHEWKTYARLTCVFWLNPALQQHRYLLYQQLLAHGDALIEPLLVFLQEFLLLVYLSPQVTVGLARKRMSN